MVQRRCPGCSYGAYCKNCAQLQVYGFISPENGGTDVFVHVSADEGGSPLRDGQKVSYDIGQDRKTGKSRAENVRSA
ncbi:cold shock domain-containing protein [Sinorhizobium sp. Sb3]|uniref:cold-shock protein n=1 Tax=Sinorhizobium sp. Sb3 TaxID=1358417 RepID=UPI0009E99895|nr:cold shock domain-containing protein [Sinorhizobium sp. Sb3]